MFALIKTFKQNTEKELNEEHVSSNYQTFIKTHDLSLTIINWAFIVSLSEFS